MQPTGKAHPHLPYKDRKDTGAADFYFAIHATFRFIRDQLGPQALREYWTDLGRDYMAPVHHTWKKEGLPSIAAYWKDFFSAEPDADVSVENDPNKVTLRVHRCPAIHHLHKAKRNLIPEFCQHCYFVSQAAAQEAGFEVRIKGGNGSCQQCFYHASDQPPPQKLEDITPTNNH